MGAELLSDVIATAYERQSEIVTTNLPFENWTEVLGNQRRAPTEAWSGAALDWTTHRRRIPEASGESYRLAETKRRRRTKRTATGLVTRPSTESSSASHQPLQTEAITNVALQYSSAPRRSFRMLTTLGFAFALRRLGACAAMRNATRDELTGKSTGDFITRGASNRPRRGHGNGGTVTTGMSRPIEKKSR